MAAKKTETVETESMENMPEAEPNTAPETEPETEPETVTETTSEKPVDEWSLKKTIYVPRKAKGDDQSWLIIVNDRRYAVPANGKMQELPLPVAEILEASVNAEAEAEAYSDQVTAKAMGMQQFLQ